jgi:hypothetical protein
MLFNVSLAFVWLTREGATQSRAFRPWLLHTAAPHVALLKLHVTLIALRL